MSEPFSFVGVGSGPGDYIFFPQADSDVVGVTEEEAPVLKKFKDDLKVKFALLSHRHGEVAKLYGVYPRC